jgi:hypothetical protein
VFSTQEQNLRNQSAIKKMLELTAEERKELTEIEEKIDPTKHSGPDLEKGRRQLSLQKLSDNKTTFLQLDKIFKFMEASKLFKDVVLDEKLPHAKNWQNTLHGREHLDFKIKSLDAEKSVSINNLYLGEYFMFKFDESEKATPKVAYLSAYWLDKACETGFFWALTRKLQYDVETVKKDPSLELLTVIKEELTRLTELYSAMGSFHAAMIYLDLGRTFNNPELQLTAAENFLGGQATLDHKEIVQTDRVLQVLTKTTGRMSLTKFGYNSWEDAKKDFLSSYSDKQLETMTTQAEANINAKILHRINKK